jgi:hypothetical protein
MAIDRIRLNRTKAHPAGPAVEVHECEKSLIEIEKRGVKCRRRAKNSMMTVALAAMVACATHVGFTEATASYSPVPPPPTKRACPVGVHTALWACVDCETILVAEGCIFVPVFCQQVSHLVAGGGSNATDLVLGSSSPRYAPFLLRARSGGVGQVAAWLATFCPHKMEFICSGIPN